MDYFERQCSPVDIYFVGGSTMSGTYESQCDSDNQSDEQNVLLGKNDNDNDGDDENNDISKQLLWEGCKGNENEGKDISTNPKELLSHHGRTGLQYLNSNSFNKEFVDHKTTSGTSSWSPIKQLLCHWRNIFTSKSHSKHKIRNISKESKETDLQNMPQVLYERDVQANEHTLHGMDESVINMTSYSLHSDNLPNIDTYIQHECYQPQPEMRDDNLGHQPNCMICVDDVRAQYCNGSNVKIDIHTSPTMNHADIRDDDHMFTITDGISQPSTSNTLSTVLEMTKQAQLIAQSIGQAFQVAYSEFLKANGIEGSSIFRELDYQEVLNQQEIFGEELFLLSNKDMMKEVIVPKLKNEPLGIVIVESGWGSMVPTVVLANMSPTGATARGGQLNIGDQIMSINGVSLVGLPLSSCKSYIRATKGSTEVRLHVVPCTPVLEVCIMRPSIKFQLGFSVQHGVVCSLLRGGIAERGGVRVGHRIIEINGDSVVAIPHENIIKILAVAVGKIRMKTMSMPIFNLLTGKEVPHYI